MRKNTRTRMTAISIILRLILAKAVTEAIQLSNNKGRDCTNNDISVVSFLSLEMGSNKKSLDDIPSLAVLGNDPRAALPQSFTICSTILSGFKTTPHNVLMFFNLFGNDREQILPAVMFGENFYTTKVASGQIPTVFPNQWLRSCMAVDSTSGMVQWVVDGILVENRTFDNLRVSKIPTNLSGKIILGAYQSPIKSWQVFSNKLTNLNIFSSLLPLPEMQRKTKGEEVCLEEGDYLAWEEMTWDLRGGATTEKITLEELDTNPLVNLYKAHFFGRDTCKNFCENLGSQMPSLSNLHTFERLADFCYKKMKHVSFGTWLAADDIEEEDVWRDSHTGQPLNFTPPWAVNEPNGGRKENCASLQGCRWFDVPCNERPYCLCDNQPRPNLKLLGLCEESILDHDFQPQNDAKDIEKLALVGHSSSIEYDQKQKLWLMEMFQHNVTGTSRALPSSFTLGKNNWKIEGDHGCNAKGSFYTTDLKLSGCKEGDFTCHDGQCVTMEERCNLLPDCRDHSDEKECQVLVLEKGYNMRVPPVTKNAESENKMNPVSVNVSLTLFKVVAIKEEDHSIELQFQIFLEWTETRALYHNLKPEIYLNALSFEEINRLWLPLLVYTDTDQQKTIRFVDDWEWSTYVSVKREGNFTRSGYEMALVKALNFLPNVHNKGAGKRRFEQCLKKTGLKEGHPLMFLAFFIYFAVVASFYFY